MPELMLLLDCHEELPGIDPADWQVLSAAEQAKANRFVFDRDRQQSVRAAAGLRRALARYCNTAPESLVLRRNDFGKPALAALSPSASSGCSDAAVTHDAMPACEFNLSHSSGAILIGVARRPLGVDVEHLGGRAFPESIMPVVFSERERAQIDTDALGLQIAGFMHWSRKEAVIKADGRGMSLNPAGFDLSFEPLPARATEWARDRWQCEIDGRSFFGATVALRKGWVCAIACADMADRDSALTVWDHW